jgi:site-specific DNA-methyltransferase (adenine-specific)
MYPEALAKDHILSWSNEDDLVLDPFMGAGTTAVCCIETNRKYVGFEIDEKYYDICTRRIENRVTVEKVAQNPLEDALDDI